MRARLKSTQVSKCVHHSEYLSSWQYWHFGVWGVLPRRIWVTACAMSPIFQVDNIYVLRLQRILLCHRHVLKQSVIERSVLRRHKPGTVFRQKWRHQWHCRHLNKNLKLTFFQCHFPACNISPYWCTFAFVHLKLWLIDWLIDWLTSVSVHVSQYWPKVGHGSICSVPNPIQSIKICY